MRNIQNYLFSCYEKNLPPAFDKSYWIFSLLWNVWLCLSRKCVPGLIPDICVQGVGEDGPSLPGRQPASQLL